MTECGTRGCTQERQQFSTGNYGTTCRDHATEAKRRSRRRKASRDPLERLNAALVMASQALEDLRSA